MKKGITWKLASAFFTLSIASGVTASGNPQFENVDEILSNLSKIAEIKTAPSQKKAEKNSPPEKVLDDSEKATTVQVMPVAKPSPVIESVEVNPVLTTKIFDVPSYTRFEFNNNVVIPANKTGVLYRSGEMKFVLSESLDKVFELNASALNGSCALLSNKNHIMMKGDRVRSGKATYLDVKTIQLMERSNHRTSIDITFFSKQPKPSGDASNDILINLSCTLDPQSFPDISKFTLGDIDKITGGLFRFYMPDFIEI